MPAFLHDGYKAAIKNYFVPIAVKCTLFSMCVVSLLLRSCLVQHDICNALNVIAIRLLVQHDVVAAKLYI